jgi:hypothetical protein
MAGRRQADEQWLGQGNEPLDDVDRLFARLAHLPPPRDFSSRVLLAVRPQRVPRTQVIWAAADLAALLALAFLAFVTGQTLVGGGLIALLAAVASDADVLQVAPADTLAVIVQAVPWLELVGLGLALLVVVVCTRRLSRLLAGSNGAGMPQPGPAGGA